MDSLEEYVINRSSCGMPRCEYVENGIEIDCDECQKRMIEAHDEQIRADEINRFQEWFLKTKQYCDYPEDIKWVMEEYREYIKGERKNEHTTI